MKIGRYVVVYEPSVRSEAQGVKGPRVLFKTFVDKDDAYAQLGKMTVQDLVARASVEHVEIDLTAAEIGSIAYAKATAE